MIEKKMMSADFFKKGLYWKEAGLYNWRTGLKRWGTFAKRKIYERKEEKEEWSKTSK